MLFRSRPHYVASDERTNTVLVTGPPDKIAQAREIMKRIDQIKAQRDATEIGALPYVQQRGGFTALYSAMPEHRGFPGENGSVIFSGAVAQRLSGEVDGDRVLDFHVADGGDQDAFDPVVGKRERTVLVGFGHGSFTKQVGSQTCDC